MPEPEPGEERNRAANFDRRVREGLLSVLRSLPAPTTPENVRSQVVALFEEIGEINSRRVHYELTKIKDERIGAASPEYVGGAIAHSLILFANHSASYDGRSRHSFSDFVIAIADLAKLPEIYPWD